MQSHSRNVVMFLCDYASVYGGNFVPSLIAIEKQLHKKDIECVYVFPKESQDREWIKYLVDSGRTVDYFDFSLRRSKKITNLLRLLDKHRICVLHTHFCFTVGVEIVSLLRPDIKIFVHNHSDFSGGKKSIKNTIVNKLIFQFLAFRCNFIFVSEEQASINPRKSVFLPNALANDRLPVNHCSGDDFRKKLGIDKNVALIEVFGWSPYIKGVDIAVKAVGQLVNEGAKICLMIVCGRNTTQTEMAEYINKSTEYRGNEGFISFVEPTEDVFCYHEAADICLSSSRSEGFSYSLLEMLSMGKRCVVSNIEGTKWSTKYETTISFETENAGSCARALKMSLSNPVSCNTSAQVSEKIKKDYNIDAWAEAIVNMYDL